MIPIKITENYFYVLSYIIHHYKPGVIIKVLQIQYKH